MSHLCNIFLPEYLLSRPPIDDLRQKHERREQQRRPHEHEDETHLADAQHLQRAASGVRGLELIQGGKPLKEQVGKDTALTEVQDA